MNIKTYPATETMLAEIERGPPHIASMVRKIVLMGSDLLLTAQKMELVAVAAFKHPPRENVTDATVAALLVVVANYAAATARDQGKDFDPEAFGRFTARISRECMPDFNQADKIIAARGGVNTNN